MVPFTHDDREVENLWLNTESKQQQEPHIPYTHKIQTLHKTRYEKGMHENYKMLSQ
jgi:hypothetical protein